MLLQGEININSILDRWTLTRDGRTWRPGEYSLNFFMGVYRSVFETLDLFQAKRDEFATLFLTIIVKLGILFLWPAQ